jgi:hypothetical protein
MTRAVWAESRKFFPTMWCVYVCRSAATFPHKSHSLGAIRIVQNLFQNPNRPPILHPGEPDFHWNANGRNGWTWGEVYQKGELVSVGGVL